MIARSLALGILLLAAASSGAARAAAAEAPQTDSGRPPPLVFRRVYTPEARLEDLPRDRDRLVPMPAEEFERLVSVLRAESGSGPLSAGVVSSRYEARLDGDRLVEGEATLEIFHSGQSEVLLPLEPWGLAVSEANWQSPSEPRPAVLGLADDGRLTVLVERRGRLHLSWSLSGRRDESGAVEFQLAVPPCAATQLTLDVPAGMTPVIDQAIVTRSGAGESENVRWRIELRSRQRSVLRVVPDEQLDAGPQWTRLRQSTVYDFSLRGVEVTAELQLDAYGEPLEEITIDLDPGLQLVTAQYGTVAAAWTAVAGKPDVAAARVVLELPEAIHGIGRSIRLTAWAPLALDGPWRLPRIRAQNVFWQEGTAALLVTRPLVLEQLEIDGGRQSKTGSLSGPRSGQRVEVQYFRADAAVAVTLCRPQTPVDVRLGVAVELGDQQISALTTAALSLSDGERFELEAEIGRRWIVDSIESLPADALDDWTVERQAADRTLKIRLAKPLSPTRPLRLLIDARRLDAPLNRDFAPADLLPVDFTGEREGSRLVWVRAADASELTATDGDPSARVDPQTLGAADLALFAEPPRAPLFACGPGLDGWQVSFEPQKPVYAADIRVEATVSDGTLLETYRLACTPQGARVQRLQVQFSPARNKPLHWTLGAEGDRPLTATLVRPAPSTESKSGSTGAAEPALRSSSQEQPRAPAAASARDASAPSEAANDSVPADSAPVDSAPVAAETWQIEIDPPRSVPFEIRATRATELSEEQPVSLASIPEASEQQATLVIGTSGATALRVENRRLKPIPMPAVPDDRVNPARASYHYDPLLDAVPEAGPAVIVARQPPEKAPGSAWAWSCRLKSWIEPNGGGRHLAIYHLESTGKTGIRIGLPPGSSLEGVSGVWVDRERTAWRPLREGGAVWVALPDGRRYPVVVVQFQTRGRRLEWFDTIDAALPAVDVPVLARHWTVWLPPGFEWRDPDPQWLFEPRREQSVRERLLGPLGRPEGQPPFDPAKIWDLWRLVETAGFAATASAPEESLDGRLEDPWAPPESVDLAPGDTFGWSVYELELPDGRTATLGIVRPDALRAIGLAVLLGVLALAWWLAADRPALLLALVGGFGVAALLLPPTYAGLASSAGLGLVACLGFRLLRRRPAEPPSDGGSERSSWLVRAATRAGMLALAVGLTLALGDSAPGQPPDSPPAPRQPPIYNVFIPVDEAEAPIDDVYQVPETLYNELHRRAAAKGSGPQGSLLVGAEYRGELTWQSGEQRLVLGRLTATFDFQLLGNRRTIAIPLGGEAVPPAAEGAILDGHVIQPRWSKEGAVAVFDVDGERPLHRLELPLRPTVQTDGSRTGFDLRIPPWAGSRLELVLPADAPEIEVLSAIGPVVRQSDPERVVAQLGPSDRLAVRWPERGGQGSGGPVVEVEELLWLKVRDGSVVLDARFRFNATAGYLSRLELAADPRLRLLPQEDHGPAITAVETAPGQPQTIRFELAQPTVEPVTLAASFLLRESSGVGSLRLPLLHARNAQPVKRWLAVWADPSLELATEENADQLQPLALADFESAWGTADVRPQQAFALPPAETAWSIATRPRGPATTAEELLTLDFGEESVGVDFTAKLETTQGYLFCHRIAAPKGLDVETLSLKADSIEQVARWSVASDGLITIFLAGPVAGAQELSLRGRLSLTGERLPLPIVRLDGVEAASGTIDLRRSPQIALKVAETEGVKEIQNPTPDPREESRGRLVGRLRYDGSEPIGGVVHVTVNRPEVLVEQTTFVRFDGEDWEAEIDLDLDVRRGLLDELRLSVPPEFAGPYRLDPPAVVEPSEHEAGQLTIRPPTAIVGSHRLKIFSPLEFDPGDRPNVPVVVPEEVKVTRHLLVLPAQRDLEPAVWETKGLRETRIPQELVPFPMAPEAFVAYRADGPAFAAVLHSVQGAARAHLVDIRVACQADGSCFTAASFDLEPTEVPECLLRIPENFRLIAVAVADVPVAAMAVGGAKWRVPFGPPGYPRRVDLLMEGRMPAPAPSGQWTIEPPLLEGLPVERTLWTISVPSACQVRVSGGFGEASLLEHTRLRLEQVREMIKVVAEITAGEKSQADYWYRLWARRFVALREELEAQWQQEGQADPAFEAWMDLTSVEKLAPQAVALIESEELAAAATPNPWSGRDEALWLGPWQTRQPPLRCVTERETSPIRLLVRPTAAAGMWRWWLAAVLLTSLTLVAVLAVRSGLVAACFSRWPHLAGVLFGLIWWLWLWPSVVGWVIVAASLIAALRPGWKRRRTSGSVIVPLSSLHR